MKLLFIVSSLGNGGAQRVASNLIMGLPNNCEIEILLNDDDDIVFPYKGKVISLGLKPEKDKGKLFYQIKVFFKRLIKLKQLKNKGQYDAAISFLDSANIANVLTGNKKCKTIATVHSKLSASSFDWRYKYIVFPFVKLFYSHADHVVAVSKGIEKDLIENIGYRDSNLVTIYNGFDFKAIRKMAAEAIPEEHESFISVGNTIVAVGRLCKAKGYWHLIRAFRRVADCNKNVRLVIVGEGEQRDYLTTLCEGLKLTDNVLFTGFVDNPFKYINKADVFVMSSLYEGLPSSLIEALALNKPCVSTDFESGAREIIAPDLDESQKIDDRIIKAKYGILLPVCDGTEYDFSEPLTWQEQLLADALETMLTDTALREKYIENAGRAVERFAVSYMVEGYLNLCN